MDEQPLDQQSAQSAADEPQVKPRREEGAEEVGSSYVTFRTASGSHYEVDNGNLSWRRTLASLGSGRLRSESGRLIQSVRPELGASAVLVSEPFAASLG